MTKFIASVAEAVSLAETHRLAETETVDETDTRAASHTVTDTHTVTETDTLKRGPHGLRVHIPIHLRWGDLDALGHVNNATMLRLIEEARLRGFWRAGDDYDAPSTAIMGNGSVGDSDTMAVIAQQQIEYLTPAPYRRLPLEVQMWIGRLGGSSVEICYEVWSPVNASAGAAPQTLYARASGVMVMLDAETQRPRRLTDAERAAWTPVLGEPITFTRGR